MNGENNVWLRSLSLYYGNFGINKQAELTKYNGIDMQSLSDF